ncbi:MAG TPA: class I SAM-dependent methyltransferase [Acidimicrobiales bacterium]|nr:class I SAM-dependent methyltransferase [Acidimicrobiales bacterium]
MERRRDPNRQARTLFAGLGSRYDVLAEVLSFGQNRRWRAAAVERVAALTGPGAMVCDVATGTAGVALRLAGDTDARVVGVDLTEAMLASGRRNVERASAGSRVHLVAARAEQLPFPDGCFDGLLFSYLLRYVDDPAATLAELARVVRAGAPVASLEFHVPPAPFWRFWWRVYTRLVLPAAGMLTGGRPWYRVGRFLGPSIEGHYAAHPLPRIVGYWRSAGVAGVGHRLMSLGGGVVMWGRRDG